MFFRQIYDEKYDEKLAAAHRLKIVAVAETHTHADFISGAREFAERGVKIFVSDKGKHGLEV
jgi:glyoxylase-like metal-dependent hydrolase (beta-lactamase superfamily II)